VHAAVFLFAIKGLLALHHPQAASFSPSSRADSGIANRQIDAAVGQYVLPLMPALFEDEDPMPL